MTGRGSEEETMGEQIANSLNQGEGVRGTPRLTSEWRPIENKNSVDGQRREFVTSLGTTAKGPR